MPGNFLSPNFSPRYSLLHGSVKSKRGIAVDEGGFASLEVVLFTIKVRLIVPKEVDGNEQLCRHRDVNCRTRRDLTRLEIKAHAGFAYLTTNELTHNSVGTEWWREGGGQSDIPELE